MIKRYLVVPRVLGVLWTCSNTASGLLRRPMVLRDAPQCEETAETPNTRQDVTGWGWPMPERRASPSTLKQERARNQQIEEPT